jgi:hypothetical protein
LPINGRTYTFRFKTREAIALQKHFTTNGKIPRLSDLLSKAWEEESIEHVVALLWVGLRTHQPELTLDDAMALFDELGSVALSGVTKDVAQSMVPDPEDVKELGIPERPQAAQEAQPAKKRGRKPNGGASTFLPESAA